MALQSHYVSVHKEITDYLSEHGGFQSDRGHQNYFSLYKDGVEITARLFKPTSRNQRNTVTVEIYCDSEDQYACFFSFLNALSSGEVLYRFSEAKCLYTDISQLLELKSKAIKIERRFVVPDDFAALSETCEWLVNSYKKWSGRPCSRRMVKETTSGFSGGQLAQLVEEVGISLDKMQEYLQRGLVGITHPEKKDGELYAALWFDESVIPELPATLEWGALWKPANLYRKPPVFAEKGAETRYWLLVANPQYWSFFHLAEGEENSYSVYTEKGNPRQIPVNFGLVAPGEKIVCYEAYPTMQVVALGEITAGSDGKNIVFRKTENLQEPISREQLMALPSLTKLFSNLHGSLHGLTESQYQLIERMAHAKKAQVLTKAHNRIISGAPGTGKSYLLNKDAALVAAENRERVTFHPEYSYYDFVGSYKPVMRAGKIGYAFVPGPFARMLKRALNNRSENYLLVIEEINRARAASVFGDVFQLLDRDDSGASMYDIAPSEELKEYLFGAQSSADARVRIPANLYIWATMNSADQGVYPMDTAFKRRWSFEYMGIDSRVEAVQGERAEEWKALRKRVNALLSAAGVNEDKLMGPFFLNSKELADREYFISAVKSKVLMYLFEDAAKHKRRAVFVGTPNYSELVQTFDKTYRAADMDSALNMIFCPTANQ